MVDPAAHAGGQFIQRNLAGCIVAKQVLKATLETNALTPLEPATVRKYTKTEERDALAHIMRLDVGVNDQSQPLKSFGDRVSPGP